MKVLHVIPFWSRANNGLRANLNIYRISLCIWGEKKIESSSSGDLQVLLDKINIFEYIFYSIWDKWIEKEHIAEPHSSEWGGCGQYI